MVCLRSNEGGPNGLQKLSLKSLYHNIRRRSSPCPSNKASREILEATLLLLLSLVVFFWPAVLGGRVLLPTDLIFDLDPLWQPLAPEGYTHPANHILSDQVYAFFPWKVFTLRSLAQGYLPLWNPYISGGVPFVGNAQSAIFSPFNLVSYLLPLYPSYVITAILILSVAGIFTFLFAREIGLSKSGALLAMVAFTFSGPMIVWLGYPLAPVMAWLPAMLLTIERALTRKSGLYVTASSLIIAAQFLGGHPETSFHVMLAWAAYSLYRALALEGWHPSRLLPQLLRIAAAAAIGALLGAAQLLPFVEALLRSAMFSDRQAQVTRSALSLVTHLLLEWHQWPTAITAILPQYFGTHLDKSYLYPYNNYVGQNAYVGVLPLALAAAVALRSIKHRSIPRRDLVLFFASLAVICLGVAIRLPLLNGINDLPLFNIASNGRIRLIYAFAVAVLAGLGLDEASRGRRDCHRTTLRILALLALISLVLIALACVGFVLFEDEIIRFGRAFAEARWGTPYYSRPLEYYYAQVEEKYEKRLASFLPSNVVMYLPILIALACLALHRWGQRLCSSTKMWAYAALGLTMLDLFLVGMPFNPTIAPEHIFPTPDAVHFLQQDPDIYRVCGTGLTLYHNSGMVFGISDIRGYETIVPQRYVDLIDRVDGHYRLGIRSLFTKTDSPLLDLLNVKYVLTGQELGGRWELAYRGTGSVNVYRNRDVLPRAFVVYRAEVVDSAAQSLQRITDSAFDFRERVVLEDPPAEWAEPPEIPAAAAVRIANYEPNYIRVEVGAAADGLLVLTDTYAPGWKALLDGQAMPVYVADHAFRAVVVPAGTHQVEFMYEPLSFKAGATISLLTAVILILFFAFKAQARRRPERT
jgi:hypothetical protein